MLTLVNILIIFFIVLILYQILLAISNISNIEGLTPFQPPSINQPSQPQTSSSTSSQYQPYNTNDPNNVLILAQQNAGNISYLKERLDSIQGIDQDVQDISGNVATLQTQVNGMLQQQQQYATKMTGGTGQPPQITGAVNTSNSTTTS